MTETPATFAAVPLKTLPQRLVQFGACAGLMLGILGLLRTGFGDIADPDGLNLFFYPTHAITATTHLLVGIAGIAAATREDRARLFGLGAAALFSAWFVLCLVLDGDPNVVVARDQGLVVLNAAFAVVFLAAAVVPTRRRVTTQDDLARATAPGMVMRRGG